MELLNIISVLLVLAAIFSYINYRFLKLPTTIGIMVLALVVSLMLVVADYWGWHDGEVLARSVIGAVDFNQTLMQGMLSFLLFAGALHINLNDLKERLLFVSLAATVGVMMSTVIVGVASWYILGWLGLEIPLIYALLFGALISPTDPIAVMGILKSIGAPKSLEIKIAGESLFNDGVAVVVFLTLLGIALHPGEVTATDVSVLFTQEAIGGAVFGLVLGYITYRLIASVDQYSVEVLLTLALVMGGYALAMAWHLSGPIAIVVAGLFIGNHGKMFGMSEKTAEHLDMFWELVDEILNAILFVMIGFEIIVLSFSGDYIIAGLLMIPLVLMARFISVGLPVSLLRRHQEYHPHAVKILTWGGLRGGISVALALSLPDIPERDIILAMTYLVVVFSIIAQGLTIKRLINATTERV
jgi:monovalent cation:H+ antiporter, CPA1 family